MGEAGNGCAHAEDMATKNPIFIDESTGLHEMNMLSRKEDCFCTGRLTKLKGVVHLYDIHNG